ncbi:MAG TPA: 3-methyl-2-oxobutanoate hydroxymethyltransferase [Caldithrix abyssi]|uniref:3-methyl-2-oxobutanoate hydroxymethyltransferase n=1 Tax=Caldithrix abyssi TaxID=187145 RepID=A0A7V5PP93_CALAY|nr:3-methyl-2-oxobutanoate hydroxymethyltransferase [Caldithrix abyssi]
MSVEKKLKRVTVPSIIKMKEKGEPIAMLTAYDALMADILDRSGIDIVLVGDSAGMVMGGYETTLSVTMEEMLFYTKSVRRGVNRALLVADMPFLSYQTGTDEAVRNAGRFLQEAGAEAVKLEGGRVVTNTIKKMVDYGIPVMGHLGLTPQSIHQLGGYSVQGKEEAMAQRLKEDALLLQEAGVFSLVLEKIPAALAKEITRSLRIPTIGIGAGADCDGQVLVAHDMLGMYEKFKPKFVRRYAELAKTMMEAFDRYIDDVKNRRFPSEDESY